MKETIHIDLALKQFYEGLSSPEEDLLLYLALCEQESEAYAADRALLATLFEGGASSTDSAEQEALSLQIDQWQAREEQASKAQKRNKPGAFLRMISTVSQYAAAAVVATLLLMNMQLGITESREKNLSRLNNMVINQEQVNEQAMLAVAMLERFVSVNQKLEMQAEFTDGEAAELPN